MASRGSGIATEKLDVKVVESSLVQPLEGRENHDYFLSTADEGLATIVAEVVAIFEGSAERGSDYNPATVLKEALKKVLVEYYPLAGRIGVSAEGNLIIECNGEGVAFVEAEANVTIAELHGLARLADLPALPDVATISLLTYPFPDDVDRPPLVTFQVTKFKCGGFGLGMVFQHLVFDGIASMAFACAWGEMARGLPLSTPPFLDRSIMKARSPLSIKYPHIEYAELEDLSSARADDDVVFRSFYFAPASLANLKAQALQDGILSKCTTFDAVTALLWRTRTAALAMPPQQMVKLLILVDARSSFKPALPKGYMGNGLLITSALASVRELTEKPLSHAVKHVHAAMALATADYLQSQIDYREREKVGMPPLAASFSVTSWSRLPYNDVDFGWGTPKYAIPISFMANNAAIYMPAGEGRKGLNVIIGLPLEALERFEKLMHPHLLSTSKL